MLLPAVSGIGYKKHLSQQERLCRLQSVEHVRGLPDVPAEELFRVLLFLMLNTQRHLLLYIFYPAQSDTTMPRRAKSDDEPNEQPSERQYTLMQPRAYQQELLDESFHNNLIIALDTGSGKTHIAVLRMKLEAERHSTKVGY